MHIRKKLLFLVVLFFLFTFNVSALDNEEIVYNKAIESSGITENSLKNDEEIISGISSEPLSNEESSVDLSENEINQNNSIESIDSQEDLQKKDFLHADQVDNVRKAVELENENDTSVSYQTHVQSIGWQDPVSDGELAGTTGEAKRIEAIKISLSDQEYEGDIEYRVHVQSIGWQDYKANGELAGTTGEARRIEAIQIRLTGAISDVYDVYYRVHVQKYGWLGWAKNDEMAGTSGYGYRLEALEIKLLNKGDSFIDDSNSYYQHTINYQTHVQSIGWQEPVSDGELAGTTGESKRIEAIQIVLYDQKYEGDIEYRVHVQSIGWQDYKENGELAGTTGESKRIEAIQIRLTGDISDVYDVYYRVHAQKYGWLGWAKNDEMAGTSGYGYRLEALEIKLLNKGESIESDIPFYYQDYIRYNSYLQNIGWQGEAADGQMSGTTGNSLAIEALKVYLVSPSYKGSVIYESYISGYGWEKDYRSNGQISGVVDGKKNVEAVKLLLTDEMSQNYDIYYRVHAQKVGWLGWAKNGEIAGTNGYGYRLEAIEIKLVRIGDETPDESGESYIYGSDGYCLITSDLDNNKVVEIYRASLRDGSNVSLYDRNNSVAQIWNMKKLSNGYYLISSSINPNVYLTADDSNVFVQRYSGYDNQLWEILNIVDDSYLICSKLNNLYLTVEGGQTDNRTNIVLRQLLNNNSQSFQFVQYNDNLVYNGIDVSAHQGNIDWDRVSQSVNFVIIRLGYGNNEVQQDDSTFLNNVRMCEEYNIPYGVYIYSYALNNDEARSEAEHALRQLQNTGNNFLLGVWFDMEDADNYKLRHGMPSNQQLVDICDTFGSYVESYGYKAGIYASLSWLNNKLNDPKLNRYDKWVAHWNGPVTFDSAKATRTSYGGNYSLWQFCSDGVIDGISGYIDMNSGYNIF